MWVATPSMGSARPGPCPAAHNPTHPTDTLKFFGCELGAQTKFEKASGTSIVNGAHDASRLSELLESFIKK